MKAVTLENLNKIFSMYDEEYDTYPESYLEGEALQEYVQEKLEEKPEMFFDVEELRNEENKSRV